MIIVGKCKKIECRIKMNYLLICKLHHTLSRRLMKLPRNIILIQYVYISYELFYNINRFRVFINVSLYGCEIFLKTILSCALNISLLRSAETHAFSVKCQIKCLAVDSLVVYTLFFALLLQG